MTLEEIVSDYIRTFRHVAAAEMREYETEPSATAAIRRAAELPDGKRNPHQCLIPKRLLELSEERLQAARKRISTSADFAALHAVVEREIGGIHGIGKLTVYDIAHRIGAYFGKVQLHQCKFRRGICSQTKSETICTLSSGTHAQLDVWDDYQTNRRC